MELATMMIRFHRRNYHCAGAIRAGVAGTAAAGLKSHVQDKVAQVKIASPVRPWLINTLGPRRCTCDDGWTTSDCRIPTTPRCPSFNHAVCGGHGGVVRMATACDRGWWGHSCGVAPGNGTACKLRKHAKSNRRPLWRPWPLWFR